MADETRQPSSRSRRGLVLAPTAFTLAAALTCFGGSLGAVLDPAPDDTGPRVTLAVATAERKGWESILPAPPPAPPPASPSAKADPVSGDAEDAAKIAAPANDLAADVGKTAAAPDDEPAGEERVITVRRGDTLSGVLARGGIAAADAHAAIEALRPVFDPRSLRIGETVAVGLAADPEDTAQDRLVRLALAADDRNRAVVSRASDGAFTATVQELATVRAAVRADGEISSSLYGAAAGVGVPDPVTAEMIHAFSYEIDFQRDLHPGDRFSLVYEQIRGPDGAVIDTGALVHARLVVAGKEHSLYRHVDDDGTVDYYGADGTSVRTALLRTPVSGARLSSGYGMRRHPVLRYSRMHRGIDFAAPIGTPVYAAGDGRIEVLGRNSGYGNYIRIGHKGGYATAYAHLSRFARELKRGSTVKQGEVIGYVGNTGLSTGPHLHYEILVDGQQVDPLGVKAVRQARLSDDEMATFAATKAAIDQTYTRLGGIDAVASAPVSRSTPTAQ